MRTSQVILNEMMVERLDRPKHEDISVHPVSEISRAHGDMEGLLLGNARNALDSLSSYL